MTLSTVGQDMNPDTLLGRTFQPTYFLINISIQLSKYGSLCWGGMTLSTVGQDMNPDTLPREFQEFVAVTRNIIQLSNYVFKIVVLYFELKL